MERLAEDVEAGLSVLGDIFLEDGDARGRSGIRPRLAGGKQREHDHWRDGEQSSSGI